MINSILHVAISLLGFALAISIIVFVHELGHFCLARKFGVKVLRFSVGFGKPLVKVVDRYGTEFVISSIPFGGYLSLLSKDMDDIPKTDMSMALESKSLWARFLIVAAGPLANFFFAIVAYWVIFVSGVVAVAPVVGVIPDGSLADISGINTGFRIEEVEGSKVSTWEDINFVLMKQLGVDTTIKLTGSDIFSNEKSEYFLDIDNWQPDNNENVLKGLGLTRYDPSPPIIASVMPGEPAEQSGLLPKDIIIAVDGNEVSNRMEVISYLKDHPQKLISIKIERNGLLINKEITPKLKLDEGGYEVGYIGVAFSYEPLPNNFVTNISYSFVGGLKKSITKTYNYITVSFELIYKMLSRQVSSCYISGPITIANYAGQTFLYGWQTFLNFLAVISIGVGVFNLLPIPMLDGGRLLFYVIESVSGVTFPNKVENIANKVGLFLLIWIMLIAISNDLIGCFGYKL